jgi:hypothetical protein
MLPFLKSSNHGAVHEPVDENRHLLNEFVRLDPLRQDDVAEKLAVLWHCFVEVFGSPAEFHGESRTAQDAYIAKFERVAERSQHVKQEPNGHLHYSVALMLHFLRIARDGARQQSALDLSGRVASLINRARERQLETVGSHLVDVLSISPLPAKAELDTEVIVDRPLDFHDSTDDQHENGGTDPGERGEPVATRRLGTRAIYKRDGERWTKRPRAAGVRRAN